MLGQKAQSLVAILICTGLFLLMPIPGVAGAAKDIDGPDYWGSPPDQDDLRLLEEDLPGFQGWWEQLPTYYSNYMFAISNEEVVIQSTEVLEVREAVSGMVRWSERLRPNDKLGMLWLGDANFRPLIIGEYLVFHNAWQLEVRSLAEGLTAWSAPDTVPLAAGEDYIWCGVHGETELLKYDDLTGIVVLDVTTGDMLAEFDIVGSLKPAWVHTVPTSVYALRDAGGIKVLHRDGRELRITPGRERSQEELEMAAGRLLVSEVLDPGLDNAKDYSITAFSTDDCRELWQARLKRAEFDDYIWIGAVNDRYVTVHLDYRNTVILDAATGRQLTSVAAEVAGFQPPLPGSPSASGPGLYCSRYCEEIPGFEYFLLDPTTGEKTMVLSEGEAASSIVKYCPGLVFLESSGDRCNIFALALDDRGIPIAGELVRHSEVNPASYLLEPFINSTAPLDDTGLMTEVVSCGMPAVSYLATKCAPDDRVHLQALADATIYIVERCEYEFKQSGKVAEFTRGLARIAAPELIPGIVDWLDDERYAILHHDLLGVLANCGEGAADELARRYSELPPSRFMGAGTAEDVLDRRIREQGYAAAWPGSAAADEFLKELDLERQGSGTGYHGGDIYLLFASPGMFNKRDLYLGVISGGAAGGRCEVLPTGLVHVPLEVRQRVAEEESAGQAEELSLEVAASVITIEHHHPVFDWRPMDCRLTGSEHWFTALTLADLRLDSDGDGLTDLTENMLLTDPDNPDTDGDGVPDPVDCTPIVDSTTMGWEERGASRALAYFWGVANDSRYHPDERPYLPWQPDYLYVKNLGPVSAAPADSYQGIDLGDYRRVNSVINRAGRLECVYHVLNCEWYWPREQHEEYVRNQAVPDWFREELLAAEPGAGEDEISATWVRYQYPYAMAEDGYLLEIDNGWSRWVVVLNVVGGELYPCDLYSTISYTPCASIMW